MVQTEIDRVMEHETDDVFMIGDLMKRYDGVLIGFVPSHLKPRLTFEKTYEASPTDCEPRHITIGVYFDGKYIGGINLKQTTQDCFCSTWANDPMERWNAEQFSADDIKYPFKCGNEMYHPSFNNLSELLLYNFSEYK